MKKNRKFKFFSLGCILAIALVLIGFQLLQAQMKMQAKGGKVKPPKPSSFTWELYIPPGGNIQADVEHDNGIYQDSEPYVNISYNIRTYIQTKLKQTWYTPIFRIEILPGAQIKFQDIFGLEGLGGEIPEYSGGFPGGESLFTYINNTHPQPGYERIIIELRGYSYQDMNLADIMNMEIEDPPRKMILSFRIFSSANSGDCDECDPDNYHEIGGDAYGWLPELSDTYDIYVKKVGPDSWRLVVNTDFDDPAHTTEDYYDVWDYKNGRIYQEYCECVPIQIKKRTVYRKETIRPVWYRPHMAFEMIFTRFMQ